MEELDDKSEQMIRLGIVALGGVGALVVLVVRTPRSGMDPLSAALFAAGALLTLGAIALFVEAYVGFARHPEVHVGPDLGWLSTKANEPDWRGAAHFAHLLEAFAHFGHHNQSVMAGAARWRRWGLFVLLLAIGTDLVAAGYMVGRLIAS